MASFFGDLGDGSCLQSWARSVGITVKLGERHLYISPVEMEISYNLSRASEKEIEDARYLYNLFNEKLDTGLMDRYLKELKIPDESVETYLKGRGSDVV